MQAFLCTDRPRSVNAKRTDFFKMQIQQAFTRYCNVNDLMNEPLYGIVYYFHRIIQLRHAGVIDLRQTDLTLLDLSNVPDNIANDMIAFAGERDHMLYVEFGRLQLEMFTFAHDT